MANYLGGDNEFVRLKYFSSFMDFEDVLFSTISQYFIIKKSH